MLRTGAGAAVPGRGRLDGTCSATSRFPVGASRASRSKVLGLLLLADSFFAEDESVDFSDESAFLARREIVLVFRDELEFAEATFLELLDFSRL